MKTNRTREFTDSQFILRRFENAGSITAFHEDSQDSAVEPPREAWTPLTGDHKERPGHYFPYMFMKKRIAANKEWNPVCISEISSNMVGICFLLHVACLCV
jgi:hypothetical protein